MHLAAPLSHLAGMMCTVDADSADPVLSHCAAASLMCAMHDGEVRCAVGAALEAHAADDAAVCTAAQETLQTLSGAPFTNMRVREPLVAITLMSFRSRSNSSWPPRACASRRWSQIRPSCNHNYSKNITLAYKAATMKAGGCSVRCAPNVSSDSQF